MASELRVQVLYGLEKMFRPIIRILVRVGIGYRDVSALLKSLYVEVATEEFGVRGRPTNVSRVAAMTGLSRKEVRLFRQRGGSGVADKEELERLNPPAQLLHHWFSDQAYTTPSGDPVALPFGGSGRSFSELVRLICGDIPPGAIRAELARANAIVTRDDGLLFPIRRHYTPQEFDSRFVRSMTFSLSNLANTICHNSENHDSDTGEDLPQEGRLERYVWSDRLPAERREEFKQLAEKRAAELLAQLDEWVGRYESVPVESREIQSLGVATAKHDRVVGLGVYYFEV